MVLNRQNVVQWVVYPLALAIMFGCVVYALVQLLALMRPSWAAYYLVPLCGLAVMEAYWVGRLLDRLPPGAFVTPWHVRAVELAGWLLVIQVIADVLTRHGPIQGGTIYVAPGTIVQFVLLLLCWLSASDSSRDFARLGETEWTDLVAIPPADRLTARFFKGGALLLLFTGLTTVHVADLQRFTNMARPSVGGIVYNVLLYFAVGTAVLVQIRYEGLLRTWKRRNIHVSSGIPTRWLRYTLALLAIGIVVALLLPTDYTTGVLDVVAAIEGAVSVAVGAVALLVVTPFAFLLSLFHFSSSPVHHHAIPPHVHHAAPHSGKTPGFLTILRTLMFWAAVIAAIVYLIRTYGSSLPRRGLGGLLRAMLASVGGMWMDLWNRLRGVRQATRGGWRRKGRTAQVSVAPPPKRRRTLFPWLLPPREQVMWYYAGLIQRAGKRGYPRRAGETPYEYGGTLGPHIVDAREDLGSLTQAYVEARYARTTVTPEEARRARSTWQRLLAALRRAR